MTECYTCGEIAERYSVTPCTVRQWIKKKKMPAVRLGQEYRIRPEDIKRFEAENYTMKETS